MVRYTRLWETMKKKGISQYRLITYYNVSAGQIGRLKKNMHVSTHTLEMLCRILECPVEDILEIIVEEEETVNNIMESGKKAEETKKVSPKKKVSKKNTNKPTKEKKL